MGHPQGYVLGVGVMIVMIVMIVMFSRKIDEQHPFAYFPYIFHFTKNNFWSYNLLKASFRDGGNTNEI